MKLIQRYATVADFQLAKNLRFLPRPKQWWLVSKPRVGAIIGLEDSFRGFEVCTNGILVALENELGQVHIGHREWFHESKEISVAFQKNGHAKRVTVDVKRVMEEYV